MTNFKTLFIAIIFRKRLYYRQFHAGLLDQYCRTDSNYDITRHKDAHSNLNLSETWKQFHFSFTTISLAIQITKSNTSASE